jgi:hypothetical protein
MFFRAGKLSPDGNSLALLLRAAEEYIFAHA